MAPAHLLRPLRLAAAAARGLAPRRSFSAAPPALHEGRKLYTADHEYVHVGGGGGGGGRLATVGISRHAAAALGDIVYIELPAARATLAAGSPLGTVESVKSASEVLSPVDGVVAEVNRALADRPALLTPESAEDVADGGGWLCRVEIAAQELPHDNLMTPDQYEAFKKGEGQ
ncbi:single hybrid motif-containing protein [Tirmania nivea]|nr:single hybrid motif-containing protein [Tirmania nivea]